MRTRLGRGFTYLELRTAGIKNHRYAQSIGLAVDKRRRNHSEESLALNVERIKAYMSKLVVLPMNPVKKLRKVCKRSVEKKVESAKKPADSKKTKKASEKLKSWNEKKKGIIEKAKEERKKAKTEKPTEKPKEVRTQVKDPNTILPKPRSYGTDALKPEPPRQMTDLEKKRLTFQFLRKVQRGLRRKRQHKDKFHAKVHSTKRRTKDVDQIYDEIKQGKVRTPLDLDLPGGGQFVCIHCDRFFIDENTLKDHFKTKAHKKRMKHLDVEPYAGPERDGQIKVDNGPKLYRNIVTEEMKDEAEQ